MTPTVTMIQGNALDRLKEMPDKSVHFICTSPPYGGLRTYNGHCRWQFEPIAKEMYRVLVAGGVMCWVINDEVVNGSETLTSCKQKIFFVEQCGFRCHDTMIYQKRNFSHPEKSRYHQVFEYVFVLSKGNPRAFNPLMDRKNKSAGCVGNLGVNTFTERDGSKSVRKKQVTKAFGMRHNVWLGLTRGQEEMCKTLKHPAMMPKWLARDLILSFSNPGDMVCDPFAGSFTTCIQASNAGRHSIGIELNPAYLPIIQDRIKVTPSLAL